MAEIKSTIDLVMERTKDMVQSKEEKDKAEEEKRENKARGLLLKLREDEILAGDLPGIVQGFDEVDRPGLSKALLRLMVEALAFEEENEVLLTGLGVLAGESVDGVI